MKNLLENVAVFFVTILSLLIIYFIVQYNLIKEDGIEEIPYIAVASKKKETTKDYLSEMENYSDVDVEVDPTKEDTTNSVKIRSELVKDTLDDTIEDKSKASYVKNLDTYSEKKEHVAPVIKKQSKEAQKKALDGIGDDAQQQAIEAIGNALDDIVGDDKNEIDDSSGMETVDDEIGQAIDAALKDI